LAKEVCVPFWDVDVHLFRVHANELLEINRDRILPEKVKFLAREIHETHIAFLRFLFKKEAQLARDIPKVLVERETAQEQVKQALAQVEQKKKQGYAVDIRRAEENLGIAQVQHKKAKADLDVLVCQRQWLAYFWGEHLTNNEPRLPEFYAFAKIYCAYYLGLEEKNSAAREYIKRPLRASAYLHEECFPFFDLIGEELKYTDEKGRGNRNLMEHSFSRSVATEADKNMVFVWFYNMGTLHGLNSRLKPSSQKIVLGEAPGFIRMYPNELYRYPMFAAREFHTLCPDYPRYLSAAAICDEVAIYQLGQRKDGRDGLVKAEEEDYLRFVRGIINARLPRPAFPSRQGFEKICVTRLIDGLNAPEIAVFDSYIISPLSGEALAELAEKREKESEAERHQRIIDAMPDKWIEDNPILVGFVHQYNVRRKTGEIVKAATKAEKCDIWRAYCKFLKWLLKSYQ